MYSLYDCISQQSEDMKTSSEALRKAADDQSKDSVFSSLGKLVYIMYIRMGLVCVHILLYCCGCYTLYCSVCVGMC